MLLMVVVLVDQIWPCHLLRPHSFSTNSRTSAATAHAPQLRMMIFETDADAACYPDYSGDIQNCPGRSSKILWIKDGSHLGEAGDSFLFIKDVDLQTTTPLPAESVASLSLVRILLK